MKDFSHKVALGRTGLKVTRIGIGSSYGVSERACRKAFDQGINRIVLAHADIFAGLPLGAALTDDDVAGDHMFAAELLDAEPFAGCIAPVAG